MDLEEVRATKQQPRAPGDMYCASQHSAGIRQAGPLFLSHRSSVTTSACCPKTPGSCEKLRCHSIK